jgi:hypothetical protein
VSSAAVSSGQPPGPGESSGLVRIELLVQGMTCAACAAKVQSRLNAIENVSALVREEQPGDGTGAKEHTASCLE